MESYNYSLPELKSLMKKHNIKGYSVMNKPEMKSLLVEREIIPKEALTLKPVETRRDVDPKYEFTKTIRKNPKQVIVRDNETDVFKVYPSMYKASKVLGCAAVKVGKHDGQLLGGRYHIIIVSK
jgi:L-rhamnose mutarotase